MQLCGKDTICTDKGNGETRQSQTRLNAGTNRNDAKKVMSKLSSAFEQFW